MSVAAVGCLLAQSRLFSTSWAKMGNGRNASSPSGNLQNLHRASKSDVTRNARLDSAALKYVIVRPFFYRVASQDAGTVPLADATDRRPIREDKVVPSVAPGERQYPRTTRAIVTVFDPSIRPLIGPAKLFFDFLSARNPYFQRALQVLCFFAHPLK